MRTHASAVPLPARVSARDDVCGPHGGARAPWAAGALARLVALADGVASAADVEEAPLPVAMLVGRDRPEMPAATLASLAREFRCARACA